ncbi:MAG: DegT/DnrJ/EryC1/StrS family aminotransferase, partial [Leptospiraceae bacterium]|nr:DegT/DnrJ/EryC1/StrS family aminotransferase [Leptospiraceae bacterium]
MPGFEVIGKEEQEALNQIFERDNGILFAHGFDALRNNRFRVREFETQFAAKFGARYCQAVTSGSTALL